MATTPQQSERRSIVSWRHFFKFIWPELSHANSTPRPRQPRTTWRTSTFHSLQSWLEWTLPQFLRRSPLATIARLNCPPRASRKLELATRKASSATSAVGLLLSLPVLPQPRINTSDRCKFLCRPAHASMSTQLSRARARLASWLYCTWKFSSLLLITGCSVTYGERTLKIVPDFFAAQIWVGGVSSEKSSFTSKIFPTNAARADSPEETKIVTDSSSSDDSLAIRVRGRSLR